MPTNNTENIYSTEYENNPTPIPSSKIGYDNTESGLEATTVQGAIDELDAKIKASDEASEITYDNTESGLEAENVQDAIDEIVQQVDNLDSKYLLMGDFTIVASNKTYAQVINTETGMLADVNTMLSELEDDEYAVIEGLSVSAYGILYCPSTILLDNHTTVSDLAFRLEAVTATAVLMVDIEMKTAKRAVQVSIGATPAVTFTDLELSEQTQDFTIRYKKYKRV